MAHQARVSLVIHPPALPPLPSIRQLNLQELLEQHLLLVVELWRRWLDLLALPVPHLLLRRGWGLWLWLGWWRRIGVRSAANGALDVRHLDPLHTTHTT